MASARERMVISAALLIRERGAHPTAIADVLAHSGAPRGSAYHYFPGGRTQLLCEAVDYAGEFMAARLEQASTSLQALDGLFGYYREQLQRSDFRAGCPVVAVAVEAGDPDKPEQSTAVIDRAAAAFRRWQSLIAELLIVDGVPPVRAPGVAVMVLSSFEGALVLARATRALEPLDLVHAQLRSLITAECGARPESEARDGRADQ